MSFHVGHDVGIFSETLVFRGERIKTNIMAVRE